MTSILKKLFGTLLEKPWEESQALIDNKHVGKTFGVTNQMSAVIIIFGISTAIFSLIFTAYLYSIPPEQDTTLYSHPDRSEMNTGGDEILELVKERGNTDQFYYPSRIVIKFSALSTL